MKWHTAFSFRPKAQTLPSSHSSISILRGQVLLFTSLLQPATSDGCAKDKRSKHSWRLHHLPNKDIAHSALQASPSLQKKRSLLSSSIMGGSYAPLQLALESVNLPSVQPGKCLFSMFAQSAEGTPSQ